MYTRPPRSSSCGSENYPLLSSQKIDIIFYFILFYFLLFSETRSNNTSGTIKTHESSFTSSTQILPGFYCWFAVFYSSLIAVIYSCLACSTAEEAIVCFDTFPTLNKKILLITLQFFKVEIFTFSQPELINRFFPSGVTSRGK